MTIKSHGYGTFIISPVFAGPVSAQQPDIKNSPKGLSQHGQTQDSPPVIQLADTNARESPQEYSGVATA